MKKHFHKEKLLRNPQLVRSSMEVKMNGEKIRDWIKVIGVIVVLIATLYGISMNFATKEEMNRRFDKVDRRFDKVERQLERMNQNFIDHLRDHNNPLDKGDRSDCGSDRDPIRYFYEFCHKRRNES
jgi:hypothetical protein